MPPKKELTKKSDSSITADDDDKHALTLDEAVIKIITSFTATFSSCLEKFTTAIDGKLTMRLETQSVEIFNLCDRIDKLEKRNDKLASENSSLRDAVKGLSSQVAKLESHLDDLDQATRSDTLLIHGVHNPGTNEAEVTAKVVSVINTNISVAKLEPKDIVSTQRLGKPPAGSTDKPNSILIRFVSKTSRDHVLGNRRQLKGTKIAITEQLTTLKASLLKKANELVQDKKLEAAWSHEGKIIVKDKTNKILRITSAGELDPFI